MCLPGVSHLLEIHDGSVYRLRQMALNHVIDLDRRLITISGSGDFFDVKQSVERLLADDTHREFSLLFLVAEAWPPEPVELRILSDWLSQIRVLFTGRIAIAAPGLGQLTPALMLSLTSDDGSSQLRAFADEGEARAWLHEARPV